MKFSRLFKASVIWFHGFLFLNPQVLSAATEQNRDTWEILLVNWFPMLLLIAVWIYFMRKHGGRWQSGAGEETNRHLEKIEQSLERIARALEKKEK